MSAKRVLGIVVPLVLLACSGWAQDSELRWVPANEIGITGGRTFVSTQTILNSGLSFNPSLHFGNEETVGFNYSRLLVTKGIFGIRAEVPAAIYFRMDLSSQYHGIPEDMGAFFVAPGVRVNIFSADSVTPWVSIGGGYGRFRYAPTLNYYGNNPGPGGSNTGVVQFGAGLDVWFWRNLGARFEFRDYYSGEPDLNVTSSASRQHNYYVGAGISYRFRHF